MPDDTVATVTFFAVTAARSTVAVTVVVRLLIDAASPTATATKFALAVLTCPA